MSRETFGMSYTDDGLPFAALNIPCVMISRCVCGKLTRGGGGGGTQEREGESLWEKRYGMGMEVDLRRILIGFRV